MNSIIINIIDNIETLTNFILNTSYNITHKFMDQYTEQFKYLI